MSLQQQHQSQNQEDEAQQQEQQQRTTTTHVLERPAVLFHVFKFAAKNVQRVLQLSYVTTSFNNTICYHMPKLWADIAATCLPQLLFARFIEACESGNSGHLHALTPVVPEAALARGLLRCLDVNCVREIIATVKSALPAVLPRVIGQLVVDLSRSSGAGALCRLPRDQLCQCVFECAGKPVLTSDERQHLIACLGSAFRDHTSAPHTCLLYNSTDRFRTHYSHVLLAPCLAFCDPVPERDLELLLLRAVAALDNAACQVLLRNGANPNVTNDANVTPLQQIVSSNTSSWAKFNLVHLFLRFGADPNSDGTGKLAALLAAQQERHVARRRRRAEEEKRDGTDFIPSDKDVNKRESYNPTVDDPAWLYACM